MKLLIIGPQGSGKGTQAQIISKKFDIPHISTGDLLRQTEGNLKKQVNEIIKRGELIPDNLMLRILEQRLNKDDAKKGFILDGFPRNKKQNDLLKQITEINKIIEITLSDEEAIKRISSRLSCRSCGAVFNKITNPPKKEGICNNCKGEIYQRKDDKIEAIKKRLKIYHKETQPILKEYEDKIIKINGEQSIEKISEEIKEKLIKF